MLLVNVTQKEDILLKRIEKMSVPIILILQSRLIMNVFHQIRSAFGGLGMKTENINKCLQFKSS